MLGLKDPAPKLQNSLLRGRQWPVCRYRNGAFCIQHRFTFAHQRPDIEFLAPCQREGIPDEDAPGHFKPGETLSCERFEVFLTHRFIMEHYGRDDFLAQSRMRNSEGLDVLNRAVGGNYAFD